MMDLAELDRLRKLPQLTERQKTDFTRLLKDFDNLHKPITADDPKCKEITAGRHFNQLEEEAIILGCCPVKVRAMTDENLVMEIARRRRAGEGMNDVKSTM